MAAGTRAPSIGRSVRDAFGDFYFNSWRLVPANLVWGLGLVVVLVAIAAWLPAVAFLPLLAVPVAGIHRLAALIARNEPAAFSDFVDGCRRFAVPAIGLGAAAVIGAIVLATNVVFGLQSGNPIGWFVSASALYGLIGLAMYLVAVWPILVDPEHEALPVRRRLLLAGLVMVGKPVRLLALTILVALVFAVSTALLAVIVMVAVAFAALVACRVVLPTLDELEARLPEVRAAR